MSVPRSLVLAGDVGGTKINIALAGAGRDGVELVAEGRYESDDHDSLESVVRRFLEAHKGALAGRGVELACFGVAGPVIGDESSLTNLGWSVDADVLERELGIRHILFLNDLEATAYGLTALAGDRVATIHAGRVRGSTRAVIAAGTGLGAAILSEAEGQPRALPTEAGHVDFAPRDDEETALLAWLRARHGRVSVERVVSGPGLVAIYEFLRDSGRRDEPSWLAERLAETEDKGEAISAAALSGEAAICEDALARFVSAYGAAAGNLALSCLALGGVYLGGGIAPDILPALQDERFRAAFLDKGRMREILADVPIQVILEPRAALLGAAQRALMARFFRTAD
ncbi:MAG TPA: glucokinase [Gemmatimonadota bacterium]|nr:glucokinase [Gemmatimonadota bacterium]